MSAELEEEAEHLAEVGGVAVGVEQREPRGGVAPEGGDDARAGPGGQRAHLDARVRRHPRHPQQGAGAVLDLDAVRRRLRREEGQPRRHRRRDVSHSTLPPAAPAAWASSHDGGARLAGWLAAAATAYSGRGRARAGGGGARSAGRNVRWVGGCCSRGVAASFLPVPYEEAGGQVESLVSFPFSFLAFSLTLLIFLFI